MSDKNITHGGKRPGAGRPAVNGKMIRMYVPEALREVILKLIADFILHSPKT